MSLALPIDELARFQVCVRVARSDGRLSLNLKPLNDARYPLPSMASGLSINFRTTDDQGDYGLCVFASFDPNVKPFTENRGQSPQSDVSLVETPSLVKDSSEHPSPNDILMGETFHAAMADVSQEGSDYTMAPWLAEWTGQFGLESNHAALDFKDSTITDTAHVLPSLFNPSSLELSGHMLGEPTEVLGHMDGSISFAEMNFGQSQFDTEWSSLPNQIFHQGNSTELSTPCSSSPSGTHDTLPSPKSDESELDQPSDEAARVTAAPRVSAGPGTGKQRRRRFSCIHPDCDRQFTSEYTRKVHMGTHEPKPKKALPCTMGCLEVFSRQHDRLRHEVAQHGKPCEWSCTQCRRFFSSQRMLQNHKCHGSVSSSRWTVPEKQASSL